MKLRLYRAVTFAVTGLVCVGVAWGVPVVAQEAEAEAEAEAPVEEVASEADPEKATTINNPTIAVENLELLLKPLTAEELNNEAAGWQSLLQERVRQISLAELAVKEEDSPAQKEKLVVRATNLKTQQTAILDRYGVVLEELDAKGGDTEAYRTYIKAVSGVNFNIFDTEGLGLRILTWLKSEEGGIRLGVGLLTFGGVMLASLIVAPRLAYLTSKVLTRVDSLSNLFRDYIVLTVRRGVVIVGFLLALASIGVNLGPILAVVGGASFVLAFALQSNLGNFASGLMLLVNKPFDVGDEVKVAGYWAFVDSISLASTKLKDFGGNIVTLPNNTVWGGDIINHTHSDTRKLTFSLRVKFKQDVDQVKDMWLEIASSHPKVLETPAPGIFPWNSYYDYYISVTLSAWSLTPDYWGAYADLLKLLQKRLQELGIELAAPPQDIRIHRTQKTAGSLTQAPPRSLAPSTTE